MEPRRFEVGFSTSYWALKHFLAARGVEINSHGPTQVKVSRGRGRPKLCNYRELFELVDEFRIAEGLTPIIQREAA